MTDSSVQYCSGLSVAQELDIEPENNKHHDKIGKTVIGELVRSKNKIFINPFPVGLNLSNNLRDHVHNF